MEFLILIIIIIHRAIQKGQHLPVEQCYCDWREFREGWLID